jgi:hypothetical protein
MIFWSMLGVSVPLQQGHATDLPANISSIAAELSADSDVVDGGWVFMLSSLTGLYSAMENKG